MADRALQDESLECPRCGVPVYVDERWKPVRHHERRASEDEPHMFLLIDASDRLLHRCVIAEA